jgi:hypothetical protein
VPINCVQAVDNPTIRVLSVIQFPGDSQFDPAVEPGPGKVQSLDAWGEGAPGLLVNVFIPIFFVVPRLFGIHHPVVADIAHACSPFSQCAHVRNNGELLQPAPD